MYDIAIIGAGPSGSTLARLIGNKFKVLLIDKRQMAAAPDEKSLSKCCGGLLAPDAQKVLAEMGLGVPKNVLVGPQLFVVRTIDLQNSKEQYYQRFYINFDREGFDRWLVTLIPANVDMRFGCMFKGFKKDVEGYKLKFTCNGKAYSESAKIIVGADGASSLVRKSSIPNKTFPDKYIAIQEWFKANEVLPYFSAIFDSEISDFYAWTIPKDNSLLLGAALPLQSNPSSRFELLKRKLVDYGYNFDKKVKREGAFILRPVSVSGISTGAEGIALIGEAAGWISPSSAEGYSYAFRSAIALAGSLQNGLDNFMPAYSKTVRSLRMNIHIKNLKSPFMYNSLIRKMVLKSGIQSLDIHKG